MQFLIIKKYLVKNMERERFDRNFKKYILTVA